MWANNFIKIIKNLKKNFNKIDSTRTNQILENVMPKN